MEKEVSSERKRKEKMTNLISQVIEMNNIAHHPDRLVERAEFVISVTEHVQK